MYLDEPRIAHGIEHAAAAMTAHFTPVPARNAYAQDCGIATHAVEIPARMSRLMSVFDILFVSFGAADASSPSDAAATAVGTIRRDVREFFVAAWLNVDPWSARAAAGVSTATPAVARRSAPSRGGQTAAIVVDEIFFCRRLVAAPTRAFDRARRSSRTRRPAINARDCAMETGAISSGIGGDWCRAE
jgi:hypothetical protein